MDGTIQQGFTPSCRIPTTRAALTSPCASQKQTSQSEGFSTRAHVLCLSVTCAVHSANRTHRTGHVGFHTHVRVKNPSVPNSSTQPGLCPSVGSATSTACVPGPGLTVAAEHVGVSCVARHGPPARFRVDPARSQMKLPPLPGFCPSIVAVVVSSQPMHTCVSRRPDCTPLHSHSHRETRPHAHAWRPPSPFHTATSHTLLLIHGRSLTRRASYTPTRLPTPAGALTRGVSFTRGGSHTRAASRAHVVSSPCGALLHTACREARTPARS